MSGQLLALAMGGLALASGQGEGAAATELRCEGATTNWISVNEVHRVLARRAVEIMRAANASDRTTLARLVSPAASFTLWNGDAGRGREVGVDGALEFARAMNAARFESFLSYAGPLSTDICGAQEREILFSGATEDRGYQVRFRFERGLLVGAEGREGEAMRGELSVDGRPGD